jgi:type I restriction enzyme R subunit
MDLLTSEILLRSKKELIGKFIEENLPVISAANDIPKAFEAYIKEEKQMAFKTIRAEKKLNPEKLNRVLSDYLFTERRPMPDEVIGLPQTAPKVPERKGIIKRITENILNFVETYINGIGATDQADRHPEESIAVNDYGVNYHLTKAAEE